MEKEIVDFLKWAFNNGYILISNPNIEFIKKDDGSKVISASDVVTEFIKSR